MLPSLDGISAKGLSLMTRCGRSRGRDRGCGRRRNDKACMHHTLRIPPWKMSLVDMAHVKTPPSQLLERDWLSGRLCASLGVSLSVSPARTEASSHAAWCQKLSDYILRKILHHWVWSDIETTVMTGPNIYEGGVSFVSRPQNRGRSRVFSVNSVVSPAVCIHDS